MSLNHTSTLTQKFYNMLIGTRAWLLIYLDGVGSLIPKTSGSINILTVYVDIINSIDNSVEVNIRICQPDNSDEHHFRGLTNSAFNR